MLVSSDNGNVICSSLEEYRAELRRCTDIQKSYEIWCSPDKEKYPCIGIIGGPNQAVIHYFSAEDGEMYVSMGDMERIGEIQFKTKSEVYEVAAYQILPLKLAMKCAEEFFMEISLPACIEWEEL